MGLDWRPYDSRGTCSRVRGIVKFGRVEYELCAEGGSYVIRRTDRREKLEKVHETARGTRVRALEIWELITSGKEA